MSMSLFGFLDFLGDLPLIWWLGFVGVFVLIIVFIVVRKMQSDD